MGPSGGFETPLSHEGRAVDCTTMSETAPSDSSDGSTKYAQKVYQAPPGSTQILLVRHGASMAFEPDGDPFPVNADGQGDPPLAAEGQAQAKLVGERLRHEAVDAIYVTNLCRTAETAAPLAEALGITPIVEPDLREVFLGEWDAGIFRQKIHDLDDPIIQEFVRTRNWGVVPGAESNEDLRDRCVPALERIIAAHPGANVVVVVHGGVIASLLSHASGVDGFGQFGGAANGSLHHLVALEGTIAIRSFNDTAHLGPAFAETAPHPPTP